MNAHDELDHLSAYLDGELDQAERARIDAHLPGCPECRTTLDTLRATVADLSTLPEPAPSEQDSWALRSAITKARKPVKRWQRFMIASGTAAAALIAIVAVTHQGRQQAVTHGSTGGRSNVAADTAAAPATLYTLDANFDQFSAQSHLVELTHTIVNGTAAGVGGQVPAAAQPASTPAPKAQRGPNNQGVAPLAATEQYSAIARIPDAKTRSQLDTCVGIVRSAHQELVTPFRYESATFDEKPAFFLIFRVTDRYELWVMSREPKHACDLLFFSQTR